MIRVLHFADSHIGIENYGRLNPESGLSTRVHDFVRRMDEVVAYALNHEADLVVFAGDAFKNRQPNPTLQREFAYRIRDLAEHCPVILLVGNHDLPSNRERASSIEIYETLNVPNVFVGREFGGRVVETRSGLVWVACAPYPIRAQLIEPDEVAGMNIRQTEDFMLNRLITRLNALAEEAAQAEMPRLLTGHFSVAEATAGSERALMLGRDLAVPVSELADPTWDYVALGHIHKHQNLTQGRTGSPPVVYSGSLECIDFGEEGDQKGFCWVELERTSAQNRGETAWHFVPVQNRRFVSLNIDTRGLLRPMEDIFQEIDSHNLTDAIVKVVIRSDEDTSVLIDERPIAAHLLNTAHANYVAAVEKKVDRAVRTRLGDSPEALTPIEVLKRYLGAKDTPADQMAELLEYAEPLLRDDEAAAG